MNECLEETALLAPDRRANSKNTPAPPSPHRAMYGVICLIVCNSAAWNGFEMIFTQYLVQMYDMDFAPANFYFMVFLSATGLVKVVGAYLSDVRWGMCATVFYFGLPYLIGYFLVFLATLPATWTSYPSASGFLSPFLFAAGCGAMVIGFSGQAVYPVLLVEQQTNANVAQRSGVEKAYRLFVFAENAAPIVSISLIPVLHSFGTSKLFGQTEIGTSFYLSYGTSLFILLVGFLAFWSQAKHLRNAGPPLRKSNPFVQAFGAIRTGISNKRLYLRLISDKENTSSTCLGHDPSQAESCMIKQFKGLSASDSFLSFSDPKYTQLALDMKRSYHLLPFFLLFCPLSSLASVNYSIISIFQANWMQRPSWLPAESILMVGTIVGTLACPIIEVILAFLRRRIGLKLDTTTRITIALLGTGTCLAYMSLVQFWILSSGKYYNGVFQTSLSVWRQLPSHILQGLSSVLLSSSITEYAHIMAPPYLKSMTVSMPRICSFISTLMNLCLSSLYTCEKVGYLLLGQGVWTAAMGLVFVKCYRRYSRNDESRDAYKVIDGKGEGSAQ